MRTAGCRPANWRLQWLLATPRGPAGTPCWVDLGVERHWPGEGLLQRLVRLGQIQEGPPESGGYCMGGLDGRRGPGIGPNMGPPGSRRLDHLHRLRRCRRDREQDQASGRPGHVGADGRHGRRPDGDRRRPRRRVVRRLAGPCAQRRPGGQRAGLADLEREHEPRLRGNKAFYPAVFGYEFGDMGSAATRYATVDLGGSPVGGIGELGPDTPAEVPANWAAYFAVADTDAAVAGSPSWAAAWSGPPGTPRTAGWPSSATIRARFRHRSARSPGGS